MHVLYDTTVPGFYKITTSFGGAETPPASTTSLRDRLRGVIESLCLVHKDQSGTAMVSRAGQNVLNWLVDCRPLFLNPQHLQDVSALCWDNILQHPAFQKGPCQIAGMETAAIPLLVGLLAEGQRRGRDVTGLIIRKERKDHGRGNLIEGQVRPIPTLLIDDILNSGESAEKSRMALAQVDVPISHMLVVLDFKSIHGMNWRKQRNIAVTSLFHLADFGLNTGGAASPANTHDYHPLWRFRAPGADAGYLNPKCNPLLVNDTIYTGSDSGIFWAINAHDGTIKWQFQARGTAARKGIWSSPCYHDGKIYFGAYNGNVYALDAATGAVVWEQALCEWVGSSPIVIPQHNLLCLGLEYERPQNQGSMAGLDLTTGEKRWEHWLRVFQHGSGVYDDAHDTIIFGTNDHDCRAVKAATGDVVWTQETRRSIKYPPALVRHKGWVTATSFDGNIYIWQAKTGEKVAQFQTDNICYTTPLIVGNKLFAGSGDRKFYVIDLDTLKVATMVEMGARVFCPPRLIDEKVMFGNCRGNVVELDPDTLKITSRFVVPDAVTNAMVANADGSRLYVPTYMNEIYAFERVIKGQG